MFCPTVHKFYLPNYFITWLKPTFNTFYLFLLLHWLISLILLRLVGEQYQCIPWFHPHCIRKPFMQSSPPSSASSLIFSKLKWIALNKEIDVMFSVGAEGGPIEKARQWGLSGGDEIRKKQQWLWIYESPAPKYQQQLGIFKVIMSLWS